VTGVLKFSKSDIFSGLNNLDSYSILNDTAFTCDYGFTEADMETIFKKFYTIKNKDSKNIEGIKE
jgi:Predicted AAA-ATPase